MFVCQAFTKDFRQHTKQNFIYMFCNLPPKKCNTLEIQVNYLFCFCCTLLPILTTPSLVEVSQPKLSKASKKS